MTDSTLAALPSIAVPRLSWENIAPIALCEDSDLRLDWDRLNTARCDLPFLSADAVLAALKVFGEGRERLLVARQGDAVVAMLLLTPEGKLRWRTFQPSQMPLGAWVAEPSVNVAVLAGSLIKGPLGRCLALSITQVDPRFVPREADNARCEHSDYIETGWIDVEGSFEQYWSERGKNLRQNMRKQRNKLAAEGVLLRMRVLEAPEEIEPAIARYAAMESAGWKAGEGTAIHPSNPQGRFYIELLRTAACRGEAVLYEYLFDERTVAMNLCLRRNRVLVVLKTTYDESIKLYSPAFLLREEELHKIFDDGLVDRVEYYGRLMDWHTKLTNQKRTLYHMTAYRWSWVKTFAQWRRKKRAGNEHLSAQAQLVREAAVAP